MKRPAAACRWWRLKTTANVRYFTDSAGLAAIDDPVLLGGEAFFYVSSHGYDFPADGFGFHGVRLKVTPGGTARVKIKRVNIADAFTVSPAKGLTATACGSAGVRPSTILCSTPR